MSHPYTAEQVVRFWSKVAVSEDSDCWLWTAGKHTYGYGLFRPTHSVQHRTAHRVAWEIANDETIADGLCACHRCDNPPCVNPSHIFVGTQADNIADKVRKGRQPKGETHPFKRNPQLAARGNDHGMRKHPERAARGSRNGVHTHPETIRRGSARSDTKLTEEAVAQIRQRIADGESRRSVAMSYGIGATTALHIVQRRTWKHVP